MVYMYKLKIDPTNTRNEHTNQSHGKRNTSQQIGVEQRWHIWFVRHLLKTHNTVDDKTDLFDIIHVD